MSRPPVALTIAGSDPSGGAGVQGDLKTFSALGAYGTAVLTALTAQSTRGVTGTHPVPAPFVVEQLETLLDDVAVDAVKIGMLATRDNVAAVADVLAARPCDVVVLDPVMVATSGHRLVSDDAVATVRDRLLPRASLVTPNLAEAAALLGATPARDLTQMLDQARRLRDAGARRVLVKGGHLDGPEAVDVLAGPDGEEVLRAERVPTRNTHGTGCALSSAVAVLRLRHADWPTAVREAKHWLTGALGSADRLRIGAGAGPVDHRHG